MSNNIENEYLSHLGKLINVTPTGNRTATKARSLFGTQIRHNMGYGFPLLTSKKIYFKAIVEELLWFLRGDTNIASLNDKNVHIWDEWATEDGELGPIYGEMWRSWPDDTGNTIDQIAMLLHGLKTNPTSRRHIVSAWNPGYLPMDGVSPQENVRTGLQALAPCHVLFQMNCDPIQEGSVYLAQNYDVQPEYFLDLHLYQRSADWFLGVPFNIASYSLLLMLIAHEVNMVPRHFIHSFGDYHLYENHTEQAKQQIRQTTAALPSVKLNPEVNKMLDFTSNDIELVGYNPAPAIKAPVAV